jgi:hypothetical protein
MPHIRHAWPADPRRSNVKSCYQVASTADPEPVARGQDTDRPPHFWLSICIRVSQVLLTAECSARLFDLVTTEFQSEVVMFIKGEMHTPETDDSSTLSRRRFVERVGVAGLTGLVKGKFKQAAAEAIAHSPVILTGTHFDLTIEAHQVEFTAQRVKAILVNGCLPGPTLKWREGDTVTIAVTNDLRVDTSIHWYSTRVPALIDGVPGLSFAGIAPGKIFVYRIPVLQTGTYWYHSHSGFQEQTTLWGAFVVVRAPRLSRATMRNIRQNLFFALVYNVLGVPIVAGILHSFFGILLSPMIASAAMTISSVSVISNALRLRKSDLKRVLRSKCLGADSVQRCLCRYI